MASQRMWLKIAIAGCVIVCVVLLTAAAVIWDKNHFGWLVGSWFLQAITGSIMLGALMVLIAGWKLRRQPLRDWLTLVIWALIALTSPAFGFLFLAPWFVLAITLPAVIVAFVRLKNAVTSPAAAAAQPV